MVCVCVGVGGGEGGYTPCLATLNAHRCSSIAVNFATIAFSQCRRALARLPRCSVSAVSADEGCRGPRSRGRRSCCLRGRRCRLDGLAPLAGATRGCVRVRSRVMPRLAGEQESAMPVPRAVWHAGKPGCSAVAETLLLRRGCYHSAGRRSPRCGCCACAGLNDIANPFGRRACPACDEVADALGGGVGRGGACQHEQHCNQSAGAAGAASSPHGAAAE